MKAFDVTNVNDVIERFKQAVIREGVQNYTYGLLNSLQDGETSLLTKERRKAFELALKKNKESSSAPTKYSYWEWLCK